VTEILQHRVLTHCCQGYRLMCPEQAVPSKLLCQQENGARRTAGRGNHRHWRSSTLTKNSRLTVVRRALQADLKQQLVLTDSKAAELLQVVARRTALLASGAGPDQVPPRCCELPHPRLPIAADWTCCWQLSALSWVRLAAHTAQGLPMPDHCSTTALTPSAGVAIAGWSCAQ
jgi:hypothetical protein